MLRNLIVENAGPPGVGSTISLAGATTGALPWSTFPSGSQVFYFLTDGAQHEWGIGTFTSGSPNTITRGTVAGNSARTTAPINFISAVKIYNEIPAEYEIWRDVNGNVNMGGKVLYGLADGFAPDHAATMRQIGGVVRSSETGDLTVAGRLLAGGGAVLDLGATAGQLRLREGSRAIILRKDGDALYVLTTTGNSAANGGAGDPDGTFGAQRPLRIDLATGLVTMLNGVQVQPRLEVSRGDGQPTASVVSNPASSAYSVINAPAGTQRMVSYQTSGVDAWKLGAAETAGSNLVLQRFNPPGTYVENTVEVISATGEFRHNTPFSAQNSAILRGYSEVTNARADFASGGNATLNLTGSGDVCNLAFNVLGVVATKLGLTRTGQFEVGGWSWSPRRWVLDGAGNTTQPGNMDAAAATVLNRATVGELVARSAVFAGADQTQAFYHNDQYNYWQDASDGWAMRYNRATGQREWVGNANSVQMALSPTGALNPTGGYVGRAGPGNTVANVFNIFWDGSGPRLFIDSTYVGNIATTSDYRIKHAVRTFSGGRAALMALRPVLYRHRDWELFRDDGEDRLGFIAHEAQAAVPSAATGRRDEVEADSTPVLQSLNAMPLVALLTEQLQDAHRRLDGQAAATAALAARVAALEARAA